MSDFNIWWEAISYPEKLYWYISIPFTIIFLVQVVLTFIGMDADHDVDLDVDVDLDGSVDAAEVAISGIRIFTVRNTIIFFTIFSWAGIAFSRAGMSDPVVFIAAVILGVIISAIVASIFWSITKMVQSGNIDLNNAVSQIAEVYIPIPADKKGQGQIQMAIQGRIEEFDAITDDESVLSTGSKVLVLEVLKDGLLLVTAFRENSTRSFANL
ncbi:MAG: hypothetical protein ACPGVB_08670 [Chitinophagales bacterium]